jgi:hypothetical protein
MTTHSDNNSDRDFGTGYRHNMRRARLAGYVLLAGLFLEVASDIIWFHGLQSLVSIICVMLIAGGVSGEMFFENRATLPSKGTPTVSASSISRAQQPDSDYSWRTAA